MTEVRGEAAHGFAHLMANPSETFEGPGQMAGRLRELKATQEDKIGPLDDMGIKVIAGDEPMKWKIIGGENGMPFRERAFSQFGGLIGFPSRVLQKCPVDLAKGNVNYFLTLEGDKKVRMRTEGSEVRAFVSDKYVPVDHLEIVERMIEASGRLEVNFAGYSQSRMYALVIDPDSKFDGPDGSVLSHCTFIGNSETGESSFEALDLWFDSI